MIEQTRILDTRELSRKEMLAATIESRGEFCPSGITTYANTLSVLSCELCSIGLWEVIKQSGECSAQLRYEKAIKIYVEEFDIEGVVAALL